jgi:hypothetical protein
MRLALGIAFLTLAAVETAAGPDDDYYNCTAIAVRKLDDGTSDARSMAAAGVGICRKYRIEWLLILTKDGNRETALHVRPNEAREPSTGWIEGKTHHGGPTNTS